MRMLLRALRPWPLLLPFCLSQPVHAFTNGLNGYAEVTAISGSTLTIGTSNETSAQFVADKEILLMQMQDSVMGPNTANDATFGTLDNIRSAGVFVVRKIASVTRNGSSALLTITLTSSVGVTFRFGVNASVQAITYEKPGGSGDYATTGAIEALAWNGRIGGVVALQVQGILTVRHTISADAKGFRGGARDANTYDVCYPNVYRASSTDANTWRYATKGEGIYKLVDLNWADGRGRIINGGGGGNGINAGGGGGGNYAAGGLAGPGYSCSASPSGGLGGAALNTYLTASRVFMGGGGGGGEGNDNVSTDGGNGGGIILIKAASIRTTGGSAVTISANGATAGNAQNDGAGGGGAGGVVVLQAPAYNVSASAPLTVSANGGNGGSVGHATEHGAGGGGGQGAVIYSIVRPTANITTQTNNGSGGCNNNSVPCNSAAGTPSAAAGSGIMQSMGGVLPIALLRFEAAPLGAHVRLDWATASESDNALFVVERSVDTQHWDAVVELPGAGNSVSVLEYQAVDEAPVQGQSYYRLRQIDTDGTTTVSDIVPVHLEAGHVQVSVFPNPATDRLEVRTTGELAGQVYLLNALGQRLPVRGILAGGRCTLDVSGLPTGGYTVQLVAGGDVRQQRIIVRR